MENSKENKFMCNFCHKIFTCGKSLGGHIRIHKNEKSPRVAEKQKERRSSIVKLQVSKERRRSKRDSESEVANGNSSYGLRENPKITQRFADSGFISRQERFCRECGEGFQSLEALFWHLDCHYENEMENKRLEYDYRITHQKRELIENRSDERVQEAAISLMMMSRALRFSGLEGLNSVAESSDSKSSSRHFRESDTSASNSNGGLEMKEVTGRIKKLEVSECGGSENSDSENFRKEICNKVKLKVSVNGPLMDEEYKKKPDVKFGVRIGRSSTDMLNNSMKTKKNYDQVHASSYKYELRKRLKNDSYGPDLWEGSSKKNEQKSNGYSIHGEIVRSHHRNSHTRMSNGCEWTHQSGENSVNTTTNSISIPAARNLIESSSGKNKSHQDTSGNEEKKLGPKRKHKCPICFKAFKSGQALGGHKRSHVVGSLEDASIVTRQESNGVTGLIDLNVPAPMEEEESGGWG